MSLVGNPKITEMVQRDLNFHVTGRNLVKRGRIFFGTWDETLRAAGFEPYLVRKKLPSHLRTTDLFQQEPPRQPDELLERKEIAKSIDRALDDLPEAQKRTSEKVLEGVLSLDHFDGRPNLLERLHKHFDGNFETEKIAATLDELSHKLIIAA